MPMSGFQEPCLLLVVLKYTSALCGASLSSSAEIAFFDPWSSCINMKLYQGRSYIFLLFALWRSLLGLGLSPLSGVMAISFPRNPFQRRSDRKYDINLSLERYGTSLKEFIEDYPPKNTCIITISCHCKNSYELHNLIQEVAELWDQVFLGGDLTVNLSPFVPLILIERTDKNFQGSQQIRILPSRGMDKELFSRFCKELKEELCEDD